MYNFDRAMIYVKERDERRKDAKIKRKNKLNSKNQKKKKERNKSLKQYQHLTTFW